MDLDYPYSQDNLKAIVFIMNIELVSIPIIDFITKKIWGKSKAEVNATPSVS